jgi:hypothetical protein
MLRSARDYDGLRALINARRVELRMRLLDLDHDAGLQNGYAGKIFCGMKNFGPGTLGPILDALDVEIVLMPRSVGTAAKIHENVLQFANVTRLKNYASLGGRISRSRRTDQEWSKFCRKAAHARWGKARKNAKLAAQFRKRAPDEGKPSVPVINLTNSGAMRRHAR